MELAAQFFNFRKIGYGRAHQSDTVGQPCTLAYGLSKLRNGAKSWGPVNEPGAAETTAMGTAPSDFNQKRPVKGGVRGHNGAAG